MLTSTRRFFWAGLVIAGTLLVPPAVCRAAGATAIGLEAGLPLVLGAEASYRVNPTLRLGVAVGRLSGLTVVRAEGRWLFREEVSQRFVPLVAIGAQQYFLRKGDQDATPVGIHAALGVDYHFATPVSAGIRIGGLKTFASEGGDLKVFSVRNGYSTGIFNVGVRYHF